jgi:3-phosphoglycerate kinase
MKTIRELKNIKGKRVLLRVDLNTPIKNGKVIDTLRIEKAIPTIEFLLKKGASVVLVSHSDLQNDKQTLLPASKVLSKKIKHRFVTGSIPESVSLSKCEVVLLENLRINKGEMTNDDNFAKKLASLADIYVNDAFSVSHREHASIVGVPKYLPSAIGLQFEKEIKNLSALLNKPKTPFLSIVAGAKFSTKLPLIKRFLETSDSVFVGGALANNFLKDRGLEVGNSLVEKGFDLKSILNNEKIILPIDALVSRKGKNMICEISKIEKGDMIVDVGPKTIKLLSAYIARAKTVLWNGPLGKYEIKGGEIGTKKVLTALAKNTKCFSVIGGGDITAVASKSIEKKLSFVSTGGGATLEYLSHGTLVGIEAIEKSGK